MTKMIVKSLKTLKVAISLEVLDSYSKKMVTNSEGICRKGENVDTGKKFGRMAGQLGDCGLITREIQNF